MYSLIMSEMFFGVRNENSNKRIISKLTKKILTAPKNNSQFFLDLKIRNFTCRPLSQNGSGIAKQLTLRLNFNGIFKQV